MKEWDKPLMDRKPKPVEKDEFDRLQKTLRAERYNSQPSPHPSPRKTAIYEKERERHEDNILGQLDTLGAPRRTPCS